MQSVERDSGISVHAAFQNATSWPLFSVEHLVLWSGARPFYTRSRAHYTVFKMLEKRSSKTLSPMCEAELRACDVKVAVSLIDLPFLLQGGPPTSNSTKMNSPMTGRFRGCKMNNFKLWWTWIRKAGLNSTLSRNDWELVWTVGILIPVSDWFLWHSAANMKAKLWLFADVMREVNNADQAN